MAKAFFAEIIADPACYHATHKYEARVKRSKVKANKGIPKNQANQVDLEHVKVEICARVKHYVQRQKLRVLRQAVAARFSTDFVAVSV